jgi:hypothetical protein
MKVERHRLGDTRQPVKKEVNVIDNLGSKSGENVRVKILAIEIS